MSRSPPATPPLRPVARKRPARAARRPAEADDPTADVLARGWIAAFERLDPAAGDLAGDEYAALGAAEHWTVETLLKLSFVAPDRAYDVALRIVELSDDPWILEMVEVGVFDDLLSRNGPYFRARLAADARRLPRLRRTLDQVASTSLDRTARGRLPALRKPPD